MATLSFTSEVQTDIELLSKVEDQLFDEFIRLAFLVIDNAQIPQKVINKASTILQCQPSALEKSINALAIVFVVSAKRKSSISMFQGALESLDLDNTKINKLVSIYKDKYTILRDALSHTHTAGTHYTNIHWRLDLEISSQSIYNSYKPLYLLELTTKDENTSENQTELLQADYATLHRIAEQLSIALSEGKNAHARRIQRYVK